MLRKRVFIAIVLAVIFIVSCKKYPDGPLISFRSKEYRITWQWSVVYFSINGYDSTSYLQAQPGYGNHYFSLKKDNEDSTRFRYQSNLK